MEVLINFFRCYSVRSGNWHSGGDRGTALRTRRWPLDWRRRPKAGAQAADRAARAAWRTPEPGQENCEDRWGGRAAPALPLERAAVLC